MEQVTDVQPHQLSRSPLAYGEAAAPLTTLLVGVASDREEVEGETSNKCGKWIKTPCHNKMHRNLILLLLNKYFKPTQNAKRNQNLVAEKNFQQIYLQQAIYPV